MQLSSPSSPVLGGIVIQLWDLGLRCSCILFPNSSQERFPEKFFLIMVSSLCSNIQLFIIPLSSDLCKGCRPGTLALEEVSVICYLLYMCYSDITFYTRLWLIEEEHLVKQHDNFPWTYKVKPANSFLSNESLVVKKLFYNWI